MEVTVKHFGQARFEAATRGHRVICDQPFENSGSDTGMTPPEFLLTALGTCAGFYATQYLKARSIDCPDLHIKVSAEKAAQPARLGSFRIEVFAPALPPEHEAGFRRAVEKCLILNTLRNPPAVETVLYAAVAQC